MGLALCILASGSAGNCIYVASDSTAILIDAGLSGKELSRRLEMIGVDPNRIQAVCLTHEHGDHTSGLKVLHRRHGVDLFANASTMEALHREEEHKSLCWKVFSTGHSFMIGDLRIEPFSVPHDAYDPVGFIVSHAGVRAGIATDMGMATELIRQRLQNCRVVVVESNHDEKMVETSKRPWPLKQRILGRQGHLSNKNAGRLIAEVAGSTLEVVYLAHLSAECNRPELAQSTVETVLRDSGLAHIHVRLSWADQISELWRS